VGGYVFFLVAFLRPRGFNMAFHIARCCRWTADTATLVHQRVTVLAQVNIMLLGDPRMPFSSRCGDRRTMVEARLSRSRAWSFTA
jgi:hypothetical protein